MRGVVGEFGARAGWARHRWKIVALALLACKLSQEATGQGSGEEWPGRQTVKIIVPFSAGSNADLMARLLATHFSEALKGTFVVENRVGTGGILGTRAFASRLPTAIPCASARAAPLQCLRWSKRAMTRSPSSSR